MPRPTRIASAGATLALAAAPIPLPAWGHATRPERSVGPKTQAVVHDKSWSARHASRQRQDARVRLPASTDPKAAAAHPKHKRKTIKRHSKPHPLAHAAGDPGNTITDFKFSPGTTTVHVGDTITWTNSGPSPHTATANDGSFDTGNLNKGASASHTFTHAGTFAYICKIHPFMHGTVVVLASTTAPATSGQTPTTPSSPSATPAASTSAAAQTHGPTLPLTGIDLPAVVSVGLALLALGWLMRGSARSPGQARRKPRAGAREP
jgi:plastocyanin